MSRSVVVALVLVAAILGGAALLYDKLFPEDPTVTPVPDNKIVRSLRKYVTTNGERTRCPSRIVPRGPREKGPTASFRG